MTGSDAIAPGRVCLRTVFAGEAADESSVRDRIVRALRSGELDGTHGVSRWTIVAESTADPAADERGFGARQADGPTRP